MIYVTGDLHACFEKWKEQIEPVLKDGDILIVCGDFGMGFWHGGRGAQEAFFDYIASKNYTVCFADGNHENFEQLENCRQDSWNDGSVHVVRHNLLHLMRGQIYRIEGMDFFVFGGGYSMDKAFRKENVNWWAREMPDPLEYFVALQNLEACDHKVDYIITHTAPLESIEYLSTIRSLHIHKGARQERELNEFLDEVCARTQYRHWYFGHLHADRELWRNQTAVFNALYALPSGKLIRSWQTYEG